MAGPDPPMCASIMRSRPRPIDRFQEEKPAPAEFARQNPYDTDRVL